MQLFVWLASLCLTLLVCGCKPYSGPTNLPADPWNVPGTNSGMAAGPLKRVYTKILWSTQVGKQDVNILSRSAIAGQEVCYITSMEGRLHALDGTGKLLWSKQVTANYNSPPPIICNNQILIATGYDWLLSLNPDGSVAWRTSLVEREFSEGLTYPVLGDKEIYVVSNKHAFSLDFAGAELSKVQHPALAQLSNNQPLALPDGGIAFATDDGVLLQLDSRNYVKHETMVEEGAKLQPRPILVKDRILLGSRQGVVAAVGLAGDLLWKTKVAADFTSDGAVAASKYYCLVDYVGMADSRNIWVFDVETGAEVVKIPFVNGSRSLVASNSAPLIGCLEADALVVHDIEAGKETCRVPLDGGILSTMSIRSDGVLIIGTSTGQVVAVE